MEAKQDRRVRKTKAQLRAGLAHLMQKKSIKEITIKELVEEVDINRSTFYLHYRDIYQLLESIEKELTDEIIQTIEAHPVRKFDEETFSFLEDMFTILAERREICSALMGENGDISFVNKIEKIIEERCIEQLAAIVNVNKGDLEYFYSFCLNGCVGLVKTWLGHPNPDSPEYMAKLAYRLVCLGRKDTFMSIPQSC